MTLDDPASADTGLSYRRRGTGFPIVFVHGFLGGAEMWQAQLDAFSDRFDVIVPDLAGYGGNAQLPSSDSIDGHARQVLAFLGGLGIKRFHLIGHSMGGMIAQQMAALAPDRIARLVCYGTGPVGVLPDRFESIDTSRDRVRREGLPATARRIAATWFRDGEQAQAYDTCVRLGAGVRLDTALAGLTAMETWDGRAALADIRHPTLVLWGDRDRSYGWAQPEALWRGIAGSQLCVLPGCGHNAHLEQPAIFNAILGTFLPEHVE